MNAGRLLLAIAFVIAIAIPFCTLLEYEMSVEERFNKQFEDTRDITPPKDLTKQERLEWENLAIKVWTNEVNK